MSILMLFHNIFHCIFNHRQNFFRAVKENDKKYGDKKNTNNNKGVISDADLWTDKYSVKYEEKKDEEVIQQPTDKIRYNDDNCVYTSSGMFNKG